MDSKKVKASKAFATFLLVLLEILRTARVLLVQYATSESTLKSSSELKFNKFRTIIKI